jgi:hypothetical protein
LARERECTTYSERINSMKSDSWSEHSQDLLQLSGSDSFRCIAPAHFSLETTAQIAGVRPTAPDEACKTKILLGLSSDERPPPLLRRLLRPARSFPPFSPGASSSHQLLLLTTRFFVFLKNKKPAYYYCSANNLKIII